MQVFGRLNAYMLCVFLYVIGYIIVAASNGIVVYTVGNSIYILGISGLFLLQNIIISDISSTRNRGTSQPVFVGNSPADQLSFLDLLSQCSRRHQWFCRRRRRLESHG